jgi:tetratricopeptide (TPR) repeat protein
MTKDLWGSVWERVRSGRHAVVIGPGTLPQVPSDLKVVQVSCEAPGGSGEPLEAARRKVVQLLGDEPLVLGSTPGQLEAGLRRRLLGDLPGPAIDARFVDACNQLAERTNGRVVVVLEAFDAADASTVESLSQMLLRSGWLRMPLLLTVRGTPQGPVAELINLLRQTNTDVGIFENGVDTPSGDVSTPFAWTTLSPDVLRVLRAGSMFGRTFEADLVARLLDEPLGTILERLQAAVDAGAPLVDRGEARFSLPPNAMRALQSRMLRSLLAFWHARLGEFLGGEEVEGNTAAAARDEADMLSHEPRPASSQMSSEIAEPVNTSKAEPAIDSYAARPGQSYAGLFEPGLHSGAPNQPVQEEAALASAPDVGAHRPGPRWKARGTAPTPRRHQDPSRAAAHLQAAGQTEAAVEQYLTGVREVAARGDAHRAYSLADQGLKLLDEFPVSGRHALLRVQLLLEKAGLQWRGALVGAPFTLQQALVSLEAARVSLPNDAPSDVVARLAATTAGVCYDLGDLDSLQRALGELTDVSRRLLDAGEAVSAARLLNDQAALYVGLGDPVRATHLLERSRQLFEGRLRGHADDVVAVEELAETHHLLARLPLHAPIRPGREADAYAMSLEHAQAGAHAYQRLGQRQELARSTAALSLLYATTGRLEDALALLADSVSLNFEKGSPLGLAVNRRAIGVLANTAAQVHGPDAESLRGGVEEVERRLEQAESVLGRVVLPGEVRGGF